MLTICRSLTTMALVLTMASEAFAQGAKPTKPSVEDRLSALEIELDALRTELNHRVPNDAAYFDCDDGDYFAIQPSNNTFDFIVRCDKIEPHLEGYRLTLAFSNPNGLVFHGINGTLGYGATPSVAFATRQPFSATSTFQQGKWVDVVITINPASAKDVRQLRLEFSVGAMSLVP